MIKKEKEVLQEITELTTIIQNRYPELVKYLGEMPNTIPNQQNNDDGMEHFIKYRNSLMEMIANYKKEKEQSK